MPFSQSTLQSRISKLNSWKTQIDDLLRRIGNGHPSAQDLLICKDYIDQILGSNAYEFMINDDFSMLGNKLDLSIANYTYEEIVAECRFYLAKFATKSKNVSFYHRRLEELKDFELALKELVDLKKNGNIESFIHHLKNIEEINSEVLTHKGSAESALQAITAIQTSCHDVEKKIDLQLSDVITTFQSTREQIDQANDKQIEDFQAQLVRLSKAIQDTNQYIDKNKALTINNEKIKEHLSELTELANSELKKALDIATFKEFNKVSEDKSSSAKLWLIAAVVFALIVAGLNYCLYYQQGLFDFNAMLKLETKPESLLVVWLPRVIPSIPLISLLFFIFQRYLREQRLAEEYRFKSTCALHFNSYIELVEKVCKEEVQQEYRAFLIDQINRLFTSPMDRIYKNSNPKSSDISQLGELLGVISPPLEKVIGIVKKLEHTADDKETSKG